MIDVWSFAAISGGVWLVLFGLMKLMGATNVQKRLAATCYIVAIHTALTMMTHLVNFWMIAASDGIIIAGGMLGITRFRPYAIAFGLSFWSSSSCSRW